MVILTILILPSQKHGMSFYLLVSSLIALKIYLAIWDLLWFHMNLRTICSSSLKNAVRIIESVDCFRQDGHFDNINSS